MFCKYCGNQISDDAKFCDGCGKPVAEQVTAAPAEIKEKNEKTPKRKGIGCLIWAAVMVLVLGSCSALLFSEPSEESAEPSYAESEYKEMCQEISYEDLARNPESHKGQYFTFTGEVFQVMERGKYVNLLVSVTPNYIGDTVFSYSDNIFVTATLGEDGNRIMEDDMIQLWGQCQGLHTYETILGSQASLPRIDAEYWAYFD